jgi:acyl-CoA synthetase (NDP forming)
MVDLQSTLDNLFNPESIAIIGASNNFSKWGFVVLHNILRASYKGKIFPVNPKSKEILDLPAYSSVLNIPEKIDMAIVVVPAKAVPKVFEECIDKGITAVTVISAGFSEAGNTELEQQIVDIARGKLRFVGPNGMGIASGNKRLNALMFPSRISPGNFSFVSQSGNLGVIGMIVANDRGVGINKFASSGNAADLLITDYLEYFGKDPTTKVIGFYMEGLKFEEGKRFYKLAKRITPYKPIFVLKSGVTKEGAKAAASHTAALSGSDEIFASVFKETGITRVNTLEEMFDLVICFNRLPPFSGNNAGILTGGGGWGVLSADACGKSGINLPALPKSVIEKIDKILPSYWARSNPVDTVGTVDIFGSQEILKILFESPEFDIVMRLGGGTYSYFANQLMNSKIINKRYGREQFETIKEIELKSMMEMISFIKKYRKPLFYTTILGPEFSEAIHLLEKEVGFPVFYSPDRMVTCVKRLQTYYRHRLENLGTLSLNMNDH